MSTLSPRSSPEAGLASVVIGYTRLVLGGFATWPRRRFLYPFVQGVFVHIKGKRRGHHRQIFPGASWRQLGRKLFGRWFSGAKSSYFGCWRATLAREIWAFCGSLSIFGFLEIWLKNDGRGFSKKAAENDFILDVNGERWHKEIGLSAGFENFGFLKIWWKNDGRGFAPQPPLDDPERYRYLMDFRYISDLILMIFDGEEKAVGGGGERGKNQRFVDSKNSIQLFLRYVVLVSERKITGPVEHGMA